MKKKYEKPIADMVTFRVKEDLTVDEPEYGNKSVDDGWWNQNSLDFRGNGYTIVD